eukprot:g18074.t1
MRSRRMRESFAREADQDVKPKDLHPKAREAPHLVSKAKAVPYELVIPTYQRWMPVRGLQICSCAEVGPVSRRGFHRSGRRKFFPPGTYVVSIDDDVERISWKIQEGMTHHVLRSLPPGSLVGPPRSLGGNF